MTPDLIEAARLTESALVCLRDAIDRHRRADQAMPGKAADLKRLADDAALSAAWRLADAGLVLRDHLEAKNLQAIGLTEPTGRGATLPGQKPKGMFLTAWTINKGNNDLTDQFTVSDDMATARAFYQEACCLPDLHCAAIAQIVEATEPQWLEGAP